MLLSTAFGSSQYAHRYVGEWRFSGPAGPRVGGWLANARPPGGRASSILILAGALLGPAALGGLKAAQALVMGPAIVVINAGGSFGLPEASRQLAERGWTGMARVVRLVTGAGVLAATVSGIVVLVAAPILLKLLYGPAFVAYAPSARVFAVSMVISAFGVRPVLTLTTTRRVRPLFMVQLGRLAFSVAAVCVLSTAYGVTGAAMADLLTGVLTLGAVLLLQSSARRSVEESQSRPAIQPVERVRRRLVRNAELLLMLPPAPSSSAWSPPSESPETVIPVVLPVYEGYRRRSHER